MLIEPDFNHLYVASDLHLGHDFVALLRGYGSTSDHDQDILSQLQRIEPGSELILLGDLSHEDDAQALESISRVLEGKDIITMLTPGNHDHLHSRFPPTTRDTYRAMYDEVFDLISMSFEALIPDVGTVQFTHYPQPEFCREKEREKPHLTQCMADPNMDCTVTGHTHKDVIVKHKNVNVSWEATGLVTGKELLRYITEAVS